MNAKLEKVIETYKDKKGVLVDLLNKERKEERIKIRTKDERLSLNKKEIEELKEYLNIEVVEKFEEESLESFEEKMKNSKTKRAKLEIMKNIP